MPARPGATDSSATAGDTRAKPGVQVPTARPDRRIAPTRRYRGKRIEHEGAPREIAMAGRRAAPAGPARERAAQSPPRTKDDIQIEHPRSQRRQRRRPKSRSSPLSAPSRRRRIEPRLDQRAHGESAAGRFRARGVTEYWREARTTRTPASTIASSAARSRPPERHDADGGGSSREDGVEAFPSRPLDRMRPPKSSRSLAVHDPKWWALRPRLR